MPGVITQLCVALITCPSKAVARKLARQMVREHSAACVNILGDAESLFWWRGKVERTREQLLIVKTTRRKIPALRQLLRAQHPYTVPELVVLPIRDGLPAYLRWVQRSCSTPRARK